MFDMVKYIDTLQALSRSRVSMMKKKKLKFERIENQTDLSFKEQLSLPIIHHKLSN